MKLEKILDTVNSLEKNVFLKIIGKLILDCHEIGKFIILVFLLLSVNYARCQQKIRIKPFLMPQMILTGEDYKVSKANPAQVSKNNVIRYSTGFSFEYKFSNLSLGTGLSISKKGQEYQINFNKSFPHSFERTYQINIDYVEIPFYLKYNSFNINNKVNFDLLGGIYYSRLFHESDNYQQIIPEDILLVNAGKWYNDNDLGFIAGLEFDYRLNKKMLLATDLVYETGIKRLYSEEPWGYIYKLKDLKNKLIGIRFGLIYEI